MNKKMFKYLLSICLCTILSFNSALGGLISFAEEVRINTVEAHPDNVIPFYGGDLKFIVKGENLKNATLEAVLTNRDNTDEVLVKSAVATEKERTQQVLSVNFEPNNTDRTQKFSVNFRVENDTRPNVIPYLPSVSVFKSGSTGGSSSEPNTPPTVPTEPTLTNIEKTDENANVFTFKLIGTNFDQSKIYTRVMETNAAGFLQRVDGTSQEVTVNSEKTEATIVLTVPENTEDTPKEYTVRFSIEGVNGFSQTTSFNQVINVLKKVVENPSEENQSTDPVLQNLEYTKINNLEHKIVVKGENLSAENLKMRVRSGMASGKAEVASENIEFAPDKKSATLNIKFKPQTFETTFKIQFQINSTMYWDSTLQTLEQSIVVTPNSETEEPPAPNTNPTITNVVFDGTRDGVSNFTIRGENLSSEIIKVKVTKNDELQNDIASTLSGDMAVSTIAYKSLTFPENETSEDIVYKVYFSVSDEFVESNSAQVTIPKKVEDAGNNEPVPTAVIRSIKANNPNLGSEGGDARITVIGSELTNDLAVKITKNDVPQNLPFDIVGTDKARLITIKMPASADEIKIYKVKIGIDEDNLTHEATIEVGGHTSLEKIELQPQMAYINADGNKITLVFDQKIKLVSTLEKLKAGIYISASDGNENTNTDPTSAISPAINNGDFVKLTENDTVEFFEDKIIINLANPITLTASTKVKFDDRLIKTTIIGMNNQEEERENNTFAMLIKKFQPIILNSEFLQGELLDSNGGLVKIKLTGKDLNLKKEGTDEYLTKVIVAKAENQNIVNKTTITPDVEYVGSNEIIVTFSVPENSGQHPVSYMTRVSTDAGFKYTSEIASNNFERRFNRLITTVMPANMEMTTPAISFMSIQSYGTLGGNTELPDTTHTNLPTNQESKKTMLDVYGANFDEKATKIKIRDEKGVIWYPLIGEAASDSMDNFIMVAFNGTGVVGNGNSQKVEIICPRNVEGSPTYTYMLAVDGKNFNEEIVVTARVIGDGIGKKNELKPQDLVIKHIDEKGNEIIAEETVKAYSWSKFRSFGAENKSFENYDFVGYKTSKDNVESELLTLNDLFEALVKDAESITFIYKNKSEANTSSENSGENSGSNSGENNSNNGNANAGSSNNSSNSGAGSLGNSGGGNSSNASGGGSSAGGSISSNNAQSSQNTVTTPDISAKKQNLVFKISSAKYEADGNQKELPTVPYIKNGRTMLPTRAIAEELGLKVTWDNKTKTATFTNGEKSISLTINKNIAIVDGKEVALSTVPEIRNNTLMTEVKAIIDIFGIKAVWNNMSKELTIQ